MESKIDWTALNRVLEEEREAIKLIGEVEFPVLIKRIEHRRGLSLSKETPGSFVAVRCIDEEGTRLGIYLGDLPTDGRTMAFDTRDSALIVLHDTNPAIFVPDLNRVVRGYESWWGPIESPEQLRQITDGDIQNVWYVKALKALS